MAQARLAEALQALRDQGSPSGIAAMARYAIPSERAFGVPMNQIQALAKRLGLSHALAAELWRSGWYEARMLAAFVDRPAELSAQQMQQWCDDFDNWAVCDTVCFALFDRTPLAWPLLAPWAARGEEFQRRAAFALLWGLSVHDKKAADAAFVEGLALVEAVAGDARNFVKKGVNMALRAVGKRNLALNAAARASAERLAGSADATERWQGRTALKELNAPALLERLASRRP
jgi:3-methyladenine DNA glycosylase AlkD